MSHNQITTYRNILHKLSKRRKDVFQAIKKGHNTLNLLSVDSGLQYNQLSGRISELLDLGLIKEGGSSNGQTVYILSDPEEVLRLVRLRREYLYRQKIDHLLENYHDLMSYEVARVLAFEV